MKQLSLLLLVTVAGVRAEQPGLTLFGSNISLNPNLGLLTLSKKDADELTANIKDYFANTLWPSVREESRVLVAEISEELAQQINKRAKEFKATVDGALTSAIQRLFLAATGLTLVIIGGQVLRDVLATKYKKSRSFRRLLRGGIGAGLVAAGVSIIIWCERIAALGS